MMNQVANSFKGVLGSYYDSGPLSDEQKNPQKRSTDSGGKKLKFSSSVSGSTGGSGDESAAVSDSDSDSEPEFIMVNKGPATQSDSDSLTKILSAVSADSGDGIREIELGVTFCPLPEGFGDDNNSDGNNNDNKSAFPITTTTTSSTTTGASSSDTKT